MSRFERKNSARPLLGSNSSYLGAIAFKDSPDQSNRRYLWLENISKELRWSIGSFPNNPCKRLCFSHIQAVFLIVSPSNYGFKVQSNSHTIVFWLQSEKEAKNWVNEIGKLISPDENLKKKRATSAINVPVQDFQTLNIKLCKVLAEHIPNIKSHLFEEIPMLLNSYLSSIFPLQTEDIVTAEVKSLKDQVVSLQNKIKYMEKAKIEYDTYSMLEEEYNVVKSMGMELSQSLDALQQEKTVLTRDAKILKNELSLDNAGNKEIFSKGHKENSAIVLVDGEEKLASVVLERSVLHLYEPSGFSTSIEKIMFSSILSMEILENSRMCLNMNGGDLIELTGPQGFLKELLKSFEIYKSLQENGNERVLVHYSSLCNESERQLRNMEMLIKDYKKIMTVIYI